MEHLKNQGAGETPDPNELPKDPITNKEAEEFENPAVDPGFEPGTQEDMNDDDMDESDSEGPLTDEEVADDDALNYKNDRDHGSYDPKII